MNGGWMNIKPQSVPALAALWRIRIENVYGETPPPLTPKEFGQLKQLRGKLHELTWDVMHRVLDVWPRFSQEAKASAGLPSCPSKPHIGFLLAHCAVAVNLVYDLAKKSDSPAAATFVKMVDHKIEEQKKERAEKE